MGSVVMERSFDFAIRIVRSYKYLTKKGEYVLSKQLLRSGTAIGALCSEAEHAQSRADFVNKMNVSLKEANETKYWLNLLKESEYLEEKIYKSMIYDCEELIKLLASIVKTMKKNR